jgi:hypothetical protein
LSGAASGREIECEYPIFFDLPFWPSNKYCEVHEIDFSAKFEKEEHSFTGSASEKSAVKTFEITTQWEIITEFFSKYPKFYDGIITVRYFS